MSDYEQLLDDLAAEDASLDALVAPLDDAGWATPTPAEGWSVRDTIAHLAATEEWAVLTLTDGAAFETELARMIGDGGAAATGTSDGLLTRTPPADGDTLAWWRQKRAEVLDQLRAHDARDRFPWFGPPMSSMSMATARLMETWAHGEDVADALGVDRAPTARLRHVAHLGVRTRGWSYAARSLTAPEGDVRVELVGPSGEEWTWGDPGSVDAVRGPALDFCLVVTQRRHPDDTTLEIEGPLATEWMRIAQAFAGTATDQRPPKPG